MKFGKVKKIVCIASAAVCAALLTVFPACDRFDESGNGGLTGSEINCAYVRAGQSDLYLEKLSIKMNITDVPNLGATDALNYRAAVTTEYTLYNPSAEEITVDLAMPDNEMPYYYYGANLKPTVLLNGEEAKRRVRYAPAESLTSKVTFSDEWYSDSFYNPDLTVTEYSVKVESGAHGYLRGEIVKDPLKARYSSDAYDCFSCECTVDGANKFYVFGDPEQVDFSVLKLYDYVNSSSLDLTEINERFEIKSTRTMTLLEFLISKQSVADNVKDIDWYNYKLTKFKNGRLAVNNFELAHGTFTKYSLYAVQLAAEGRATFTVTQPVYPSFYGNKYEYVYNCSFVEGFSGFGGAELEIITDKKCENSSCRLEQTDTGFKCDLPVIGDKVIIFSLYSGSEPVQSEPEQSGSVVGTTFLVYLITIGCFGLIRIFGGLIYLMVKLIRK